MTDVKFVYSSNPLDNMVGYYLRRKGMEMVSAAKRKVGKNTGRLRQSISSNYKKRGTVGVLTITANMPYAKDHHEGTRRHVITPKRAQMLRFSAGSRIVYTRKVEHPGTRPNHFLTDTFYLIR